MYKRLVFLFLFWISFQFSYSQSIDSLKILIKDIQRGQNDSVRISANEKFQSGFSKLLMQQGSFEMNFDSLKNISVVKSEDDKFRIYSWVLPHYDGNQFDYFGYLQVHNEKYDTLITLHDSTSTIKKPESEKLTPARWIGAVYYSVIKTEKSGKVYYSLLGWKGVDKNTTQKIIEVLYFAGNQPRLGFPLFKTGSVYRNRMIFSFSTVSTMTLHYNSKVDGIVFDHLSFDKIHPEQSNGPDGTFDAFKWKKGKWVLYKDIDVRVKLD